MCIRTQVIVVVTDVLLFAIECVVNEDILSTESDEMNSSKTSE